jgi:hypothetical protein
MKQFVELKILVDWARQQANLIAELKGNDTGAAFFVGAMEMLGLLTDRQDVMNAAREVTGGPLRTGDWFPLN